MPRFSPTPPRRVLVAAYLLGAAALLVWAGRARFDRHGDAWEYFAALEAFDRHHTFDIRPGDREAAYDHIYARYRRPLAETDPPEALAAAASGWVMVPERAAPLDMYAGELRNGFVPAPDGRLHALHFWLYPLAAYPAKLALRAAGGWEFNALRVANAALFALAVGVVLFRGGGPVRRRLAFALFGCVTPVVWYIPFTGAEVFSWSLAMVAMVGLDTERYARGALAAGLAATQNPPLVLLAAAAVACAVVRRRWGSAALAVAGMGVAFLPAAYYLHHFGQPSLITRRHTDASLISVGRSLCLLFDLNVGLLPYVPVLLAAACGGVVAVAARRDVRGGLVVLALAGMFVGVQVQVNWNSDCAGMMRYLVWMLPPLAWLAVEALGGRARLGAAAASAVVSGGVLAFDPPTPANYMEHRPLARWAMTHWPAAYNPEFEIFVDRLGHQEDLPFEPPPGATLETPVALPLAFGREDGGVTKLLVHRESASRLTQRFTIDPGYLPELLRVAGASEKPVYVHPPAGAVRAEAGTVHGVYAAWQILRLDGGRP